MTLPLYVVMVRCNLDDVLVGIFDAHGAAVDHAHLVLKNPRQYLQEKVNWQSTDSEMTCLDIFQTDDGTTFRGIQSFDIDDTGCWDEED